MIPRKLHGESDNGPLVLSQTDILTRSESIIVLGEAGSGKTELSKWLNAQDGYKRCTARQLINHPNPQFLVGDASVLVIDALDEVSNRQAGESVDLVLQALGKLAFPRFILSCRIADWRSATSLSAISEQYLLDPLELYLQPFTQDDVQRLLSERLGPEKASEVVEHFESRQVADLLSNPQTLLMIAKVSENGSLPKSVGELFENFVDIAWHEHSDIKVNGVISRMNKEHALDAIGAGFAALILTGSDALSRNPRQKVLEDGDLSVFDVSALPSAEELAQVLDSRLFATIASDRFTYIHRRVGEFLGARWLAHQTNTKRKRQRLIKLFQAHEVVPASLRGIHAWLAWHAQDLALDVITKDPMGVIEYGDADELTLEQSRRLLTCLEMLASKSPRFRNWEPISVRALLRPELVDELHRIIAAPETPERLRLLILESVKGSWLGEALSSVLKNFLMDTEAWYSTRKACGDALIGLTRDAPEWASVLEELREKCDDDSLRLTISLLSAIKFNAVSDEQIAQIVCARLGLTICAVPQASTRHLIGTFYSFERELPDHRLDGVLNALYELAHPFVDEHDDSHDEFGTLVADILARRLALSGMVPSNLRNWLKLLNRFSHGGGSSTASIANYFVSDTNIRRQLQRMAVFQSNSEKNIWLRVYDLTSASSGLAITEEDNCLLVETAFSLDEFKDNWRDFVLLSKHSETEGALVRAVAKEHLLKQNASSEAFEWLAELTKEVVPDWKIEQEKRKSEREERQRKERQSHRDNFQKHRKEMLAGSFGVLINPAKAYLGLFNDLNHEMSTHERIGWWIGEELADIAHQGFEAFLRKEPNKPNAQDVTRSFAEGKRWEASYIVVAGLAERLRLNISFSDLHLDVVQIGYYELKHSQIDTQAGITGLSEAIEDELKRRGQWQQSIKGWFEPQLEIAKGHVDGLYSLMRNDSFELATGLAKEWLANYLDHSIETETELVDRLVSSKEVNFLLTLLPSKLKVVVTDKQKLMLWESVALLVDFESASERLGKNPIDADLLWNLRSRTGNKEAGKHNQDVSLALIYWIISKFRAIWPAAFHPSGVSSGDRNPWDAADYLFNLIAKIGTDISDRGQELLAELNSQSKDSYSEYIQIVIAEQTQNKVEAAFALPKLRDISSLIEDKAPTDAIGLQAVLLEELHDIRHQLVSGGDPSEPQRGFFSNGIPLDEETCRDHLLILLRGISFEINLVPEGHAADDKEIDISCFFGAKLMVPIEVKGQWHDDLWRAADTQLARLYTTDWRAERRGIYLVLWFGGVGKSLKNPPKGIKRPDNPEELRKALIENSSAARSGLVEIVVLDLSRK